MDRISIRANYETEKVPCDGRVGDLVVLSPMREDDFDGTPVGRASVWICTKSAWDQDRLPAVWSRVQFDGFATCKYSITEPPQDIPNLSQG